MRNIKRFLVVALIIIVASVVVYGFYRMLERRSDENMAVCTAEALQCPDGSYVGRGGAQCAFSPCPNQPSFTGTLRQDSNGFTLIIAAPPGGMEVAYAMPLTIKVSNVVGQLVGQKVRVYGSFTQGAMLAVDRLEELSGDVGDREVGDVSVGESVFINGVRITLNKIVQDSRCPVDVQCIQAGAVTANVTLQSNTDKETKTIVSNAAPIAFDSYHISIENVKPSRVVGAMPAPESYRITFRVRAN